MPLGVIVGKGVEEKTMRRTALMPILGIVILAASVPPLVAGPGQQNK